MRTWVKCKYIKEITPQMKFLFELYKNEKDNKNLIKALTKQINYCDNKVYNSLMYNKDRIFNNGKYFVSAQNYDYNYNLSDLSKSKGILRNIRVLPFFNERYSRNMVGMRNYMSDRSFILRSASILSQGTYRLYKNEIYKLCNKT